MVIPNPDPGSDAAIALGCTCPVLDNNHGAGVGCTGWLIDDTGFDGLFWINNACPLHGSRFSVDGVVHRVDDLQCPECFGDWPKRCACGGLVHREQCSDADDAGGYEFFDILRCDKCDDLRI